MIFDQILDLEIRVDRAEVRRYLGYPRDRRPRPRVQRRFEGRWDVKAQADLLGLLGAGVGVRLTPASMLVPHKSVSFAVRFREQPPPAVSRAHKCRRCDLLDCPYREVPHP